jgi:diacylglycerol kinase (ATP)
VRVTLFHNPSAGDAQATAKRLTDILTDAGYQVRYQSTDEDWRSALEKRLDMAVVAGGDGTVAKLARAVAEREIPLAILPFGTANNIAKALGIFGDVRELVASWKDAEPTIIDIGVVSGPWGEQRFIESVGGGIFAELIERGEQEVDDAVAMVGRETDRALQLLRRIVREAEPADWHVELDGRDLSGSYLAVEAMQIGFAGPNVPLTGEPDLTDGLLEVVLIRDDDRHRLEEYVTGRLERASALMPSLDVRTGRHVRMIPPDGLALHVDDEIAGDAAEGADPVITAFVRPMAIRIVGGRGAPNGTPEPRHPSQSGSTDGPDAATDGGRDT